MQIPCVYIPGPAPAVSVANRHAVFISAILDYSFQQATRNGNIVDVLSIEKGNIPIRAINIFSNTYCI